MSLLKKLFSGNTGASKSKPVKARQTASSERPAEDAGLTIAELLKVSPCESTTMRYDLGHPPSLNTEVLTRLRHHVKKIPPMPETWHKIQRVLQQPDASARDLGVIIADDPILTAKVLQTCNSAAYTTSTSASINNIPLAVARLGLDETSNIIFHTLAPQMGDSSPEKKLQSQHIWMHSQAMSMLMRSLAEPCMHVSHNDASLIGLLHDIGKLVILHIEDESLLDKMQASIEGGLSALEAEYQHLGYTHIDAGMMLALRWRLPNHVQHFIAHHHHASHLPLDQIPDHLQHHMMMLNLAHMILQHCLIDESGSLHKGIWQHDQSVFVERAELYIKNELELPLDSPRLFAQLEQQVERIKLSFPDIYPVNTAT